MLTTKSKHSFPLFQNSVSPLLSSPYHTFLLKHFHTSYFTQSVAAESQFFHTLLLLPFPRLHFFRTFSNDFHTFYSSCNSNACFWSPPPLFPSTLARHSLLTILSSPTSSTCTNYFSTFRSIGCTLVTSAPFSYQRVSPCIFLNSFQVPQLSFYPLFITTAF